MGKRKSKKNNKRSLIGILIVALICVASISAAFLYNKKPLLFNRKKEYITGELFSLNASANMLDSLYNETNIVISPYNINTSLAIIYNGTDNNSKKEIEKYFKATPDKVNEIIKNKNTSLTSIDTTKKNSNYEKYISTLYEKKYNDLKINDINKLTQKEKDELITLLRKIELITDGNKVKEIEKYRLTDKERTYNSYVIREMIDKILIAYEKYLIENKIVNYHELYYDKNGKLKIDKEYSNLIKKYYNTEITEIDFKDKQSNQLINEKLNQKTTNTVKRIIDENTFEKTMISINSLYFNYEWENNFISENIIAEEFTDNNDNHYLVDMMFSEEQYYLENNDAIGFIKNFEGNTYSFVGILPKTKEFKLSNINIKTLLQSKKETKVYIGLPKFEIESFNNLEKLFKINNIQEIFTEKANLHSISEEETFISKAIQKETITIGEYGTVESSLKTSSLSTNITDKSIKSVVLNRPFAFLIINNDTEEVLLIGRYNNPEQK